MDIHATADTSTHDEVSLLLPWYINGSLGDRQKTLVGEHVRNCIACRRQMEIETRTLAAFRAESPLDQSAQAGFERLHVRIAAREPSRSRRRLAGAVGLDWNRVLDKIQSWTGMRPGMAMAALPLAVIALAFGLTRLPQQTAGDSVYGPGSASKARDGYQTLSSHAGAVAKPWDVQVIFAPGTSNDTIERLLRSIPATIVDGPTGVGVYTLKLPELSADADFQAAIVALRARQEVAFAEAAHPLSIPGPGKAKTQ